MTRSHLEHLRGLTQFERCWGIIDSHLALYDQAEALAVYKEALRRLEEG